MLRYAVSAVDFRYSYGALPVSTLIVNLSGSLVIGLLWGLFEAYTVSAHLRMFIFIGVLGGFTTFSTFTLENFHLIRNGDIQAALLNILISNVAGILLVYAGYSIAKLVRG